MTGAIPTHGRTVVVTGWGGPLQVREYPITPPRPGALLVRVDRATVCGSDVHAWKGALRDAFAMELPIMLGHEMVGTVVAAGAGATVDAVGNPVAEGDRVVWGVEPCGHCYQCSVEPGRAPCPHRRIWFQGDPDTAPHFHGAFAEYTYVWPNSPRLRVPDGVRSEWASAASCALRTVVNAAERLGPVDYRHTVVVQGDGPLGLFATALWATQSPQALVVIGGSGARLAIAEAWGAGETISLEDCPTPEERRERVMAATAGRGADVIGEFSGAPGAFAEGLGIAAPNSRYVVVGTVAGPAQAVLAHQITHKDMTITGAMVAGIGPYHHALAFLERGRSRFDWDLMLGRTYGLGDLTDGLERMHRAEEIKAVLDPRA
jgi:threonine dehydrogenase-like Zn-dependent dehydrogenase